MAHHAIDYIEMPASDLPAQKAFYETVFGWQFTDYGPAYTSFAKADAGVDGGFTTETQSGRPGVLVVLFSDHLEGTLDAVSRAGGRITRQIFDFPGGRRFHFHDPAGNELAVWGVPVAGPSA